MTADRPATTPPAAAGPPPTRSHPATHAPTPPAPPASGSPTPPVPPASGSPTDHPTGAHPTAPSPNRPATSRLTRPPSATDLRFTVAPPANPTSGGQPPAGQSAADQPGPNHPTELPRATKPPAGHHPQPDQPTIDQPAPNQPTELPRGTKPPVGHHPQRDQPTIDQPAPNHHTEPSQATPVAGGDLAGDRPAAVAAEWRIDPAAQPGGRPRSLADRQAELVEAVTSRRPVPEGFDGFRVEAARVALLRKRAGEVARQWPLLAAGFGTGWTREFAGWAAARPTRGSLRDGWDLARELAARGALPATAGSELAEREATWRYDGASAPQPRRLPAVRLAAGSVAVQFAGRVRILRRP
jgi:hypothetical protein